jgi:hypothetical protein
MRVGKFRKKTALDFCPFCLETFFDIALLYGVFELSSQQNAQKRDKTKDNEENHVLDFLSISFVKGFRQGFFVKCFRSNGVFEPPLSRKAQNCTYKKCHQKKSVGGWMGLGFSKCTEGGPSTFVREALKFF